LCHYRKSLASIRIASLDLTYDDAFDLGAGTCLTGPASMQRFMTVWLM
jgi:hypothetical protein